MSERPTAVEAPPASPQRRLRWRPRPDPLGLLVAAAALVIFVVHGFEAALWRDLAIYAYGGQQFAEGVPPYAGIMNRAGPLAHLVPGLGAIGARLVGIDDVLGMRLLFLGLSVVTVWALYVLGRELFGSRLVGLVTSSSLVAFQGYMLLASGGPREKTTMLLFLVITLWACLKQRWLVAGIAVGLATLTWQPVFFIATAVVLVAITALRGWAILRAICLYALGGAIPTAICVAGFWMAGALQDFLDGFVLVNYKYTAGSPQSGLVRFLGYGTDQMWNGFGWSIVLILLGMAVLAVAGVVRIPALLRDRDPAAGVVVGGAVGLGVTALFSLKSFNGWADLLVALPFAALGLGIAAKLLLDHTPPRLGTRLVAAGTVVTLVAALATSIVTRDHGLEDQRRELAAVMQTAPDDATIMSFGASEALVLTGQTNPSQHQNFHSGLNKYIDSTYPGGLAGFADFVATEQPTFLAFDNPKAYRWLHGVMKSDYVRLGTVAGSMWFVSRSVGESEIERLRAVRDQVRGVTDQAAAAATAVK